MEFPFKLKPDARFDVVGFGTNAVDFLIEVPHYPNFNSKIELSDYTQAAGGEIATTMAGLRRLGLKSSYIGRFGSDAAGEIGLGSLRAEGVDLTYASIIDGAQTQIAFIIIDEQTGERTVIWKRDEKLRFSAAEAPVEAVKDAKVLHFTPHDVEACIRLAEAAREDGTIVSIDIDNLFDGVDVLLRSVDIIVASSDLLERMFPRIEKRLALTQLQERFGSGVVGVTLGRAGSLLLSGGEFIETDGFDVPGTCRDTTGAGDSFRVGLLYGLLTGKSIEESATIANAVAALKCREVGARTALPTPGELDSFLKNL
jgi:sugar/nucleoside kinase (ribokinase family)